jgi:DNA-directed RNA polymerase I subunit RPA2
MPFCEKTGMRPDLILNPNALPSRMTIGMLIESACSKAGALEWKYINSSPFQCADGQSRFVTNFFADILENHGFCATGGEHLQSGVSGKELMADIHIGCVFYQRLRHIVSDKVQVRSVGAKSPFSHQPTHGRKFGGGIRFGEMERDSLLAHGAAFLLHDRLNFSSDLTRLDICRRCGSLVSLPLSKIIRTSRSTINLTPNVLLESLDEGTKIVSKCLLCDKSDQICRVALPYVLRHLAVELASMNVKMQVEIK